MTKREHDPNHLLVASIVRPSVECLDGGEPLKSEGVEKGVRVELKEEDFKWLRQSLIDKNFIKEL